MVHFDTFSLNSKPLLTMPCGQLDTSNLTCPKANSRLLLLLSPYLTPNPPSPIIFSIPENSTILHQAKSLGAPSSLTL